jgi:integrase
VGEPDRRRSPVIPLDGLVFTSERGNSMHGENMSKLLAADLAAAGLPRVVPHALRHSCATLLLSQGVPLPVVSRILGHSSVRITMDIYVGAIPGLERDAADKMQEAIG